MKKDISEVKTRLGTLEVKVDNIETTLTDMKSDTALMKQDVSDIKVAIHARENKLILVMVTLFGLGIAALKYL